jgi:hypothetical protein
MSPWRSLACSCGMAIAFTAAASTAAAQSIDAATVAAEWLGPRAPGASVASTRRPLWQGRGAMAIEQQEATRVIRSWWPASIADAKAAAMLDGFASFLAAHAVEHDFDLRYLRTAHSVESRPYFGGHIIWSFPSLRISRHAAAGHDGYPAVFDSLERWIGAPALQGAMFEVARLPVERLTADSIVKTISAAAGQDLSWAFDAAATPVNYRVDALSDKSVTVSRQGFGVFTGRAAPRIDGFESGDALELMVKFEDGSESSVRWDGRDEVKQFEFAGPSRAIAAYLDPDRIVTLDGNRLDNSIVAPAPTNVPVGKWAARWMVWLQHTMLSYGFLA